ncbi:MAG TPA: glycosyltransferase family 4 protein [Jatrophihabitans sp.]|nr:glycosyltransferase family 4 protein [Jatrophihabitans sp.]
MPGVLQVHWTAPPVTGGVEVHCAALTDQLRKLGVPVDYLTGTPGAPGTDRAPALELGARPTPDQVDALVERCAAADLIHWHNPQWHKPDLTRTVRRELAGRGWSGELVLDLHNLAEEQEHWAMLDELSDHYVVHSDFIATEVRRRLPAKAVEVMPLALPGDPEPYELPRHAGTVVLQPTRLTRWKGSHLSLCAAAELLDEGADFAFVHAGSQHLVWPPGIPEEHLRRAETWTANGRIAFVQYSAAQSWSAIAAADVIVHPTIDNGAHGEPFSLSVAQAIIAGRRIVASRSGHLPALLADYSACTLVPPGDQDALTGAWRAALADGPPRLTEQDRTLGARLREAFAATGQRHLDLYERLLAGQR